MSSPSQDNNVILFDTPAADVAQGRQWEHGDVFDALYRHAKGDSIIALGAKTPTKKRPEPFVHYWMPLRVEDRERMLPGVYEHFTDKTLYYMPNPLNERALVKHDGDIEAYYEAAFRGTCSYFPAKRKYVSELAAILVDLDVGRPGIIPADSAMLLVIQEGLRGNLPLPSFAAYSGQGCYLLWALVDETGKALPEASNENIHYWEVCCDGLLKRLEHLYADTISRQLSHWFKAPGTLDEKTGKEVVYLTVGVGSLDALPRYTLPALAEQLAVHAVEDRAAAERLEQAQHLELPEPLPAQGHAPDFDEATEETAPRTRKVKPGKGGEPYMARAQEIVRVWNHRPDGIPRGFRHTSVWYYFVSLLAYYGIRFKGNPARAYREARRQAADMNTKLCRPPLTPSELRKALTGKRRRLRAETIRAALRVTAEEQASLGLQALVFPTEKKRRQAVALAERDARREQRQAIEASIHAGATNERLRAEYGVSAAYLCAMRKRLGVAPPKRKTGQERLF